MERDLEVSNGRLQETREHIARIARVDNEEVAKKRVSEMES